MTHRLRRSLVALAVPALAPGLLLAGAPAGAADVRPTEIIVRDALETRTSHDIREVRVYSGSAHDPAAVAVTYARKPRVGDTVKIWFDLDDDPRPEYLARFVVGKELQVFRTGSWVRKTRKPVSSPACFTLFEAGKGVSVSVVPGCVEASSMRASVTAKGQGVTASDHSPARRTWSRQVPLIG